MRITAYMLSCRERALVRRETIERLGATDWGEPPHVVLDPAPCERPQERQARNARSLLARAIADGSDFLLFLEDDLEFNRYLRRNRAAGAPLAGSAAGGHFFGSLYNPGIRELTREPAFFIADPDAVYGSQAFVCSLATARHIERCWDEVVGMQDIKMSRLAGQVGSIYYHTPSLVQHVPVQSVWGGAYHRAADYARDWRAAAVTLDDETQSSGRFDRDAILRQMRAIDGWLADEEANLLMTTVAEALDRAAPNPAATFVEIGSFCGRSTVVLGLTIKALGSPHARLYAIDPHEGEVSTLEQGVMRTAPTLEPFTRNVAGAGLGEIVVPLVARTPDVAWDRPVAFLLVDGLHDYAHVSGDFAHFDPFMCPGGFVAFHDYAHYFPGVKRTVDDLLATGAYRLAHLIGSLAVLEKVG